MKKLRFKAQLKRYVFDDPDGQFHTFARVSKARVGSRTASF
jgi:hypothetical protein